MATAILSATQKNSFVKEYELPDVDRRALRALADEPGGEISRLQRGHLWVIFIKIALIA